MAIYSAWAGQRLYIRTGNSLVLLNQKGKKVLVTGCTASCIGGMLTRFLVTQPGILEELGSVSWYLSGSYTYKSLS